MRYEEQMCDVMRYDGESICDVVQYRDRRVAMRLPDFDVVCVCCSIVSSPGIVISLCLLRDKKQCGSNTGFLLVVLRSGMLYMLTVLCTQHARDSCFTLFRSSHKSNDNPVSLKDHEDPPSSHSSDSYSMQNGRSLHAVNNAPAHHGVGNRWQPPRKPGV